MPKNREEIKKVILLNSKGYAGIGLSQKTLTDLNVDIGDYIRIIVDYDNNRISLERI